MPDKDKVRQQLLSKRNALDEQQVRRVSQQIQKHVILNQSFNSAKQVGAYYAFGSEVRTELIIEEARKMGKRVCLPRVEGHRISFYEFTSDKDLVRGRFGIMEPPPGREVTELDLVVVPGVGFDTRGYRLGYGKAYYDRFLAENPTYSIGLAFSFQIIERIPSKRHDRRVDALATEKGLIKFGA